VTPRLPDEPKGWRELRAKAQKERDPKKLDALIKQMNSLLSRTEKSKPGKKANGPAASPKP
jgi:hypothetical protein